MPLATTLKVALCPAVILVSAGCEEITGAVAAMNVMLSLMLLPILAASGLGIAAATLVGTALGRGDATDARRWGWEVAGFGALAILPFSLAVFAAPRSALGLAALLGYGATRA